MGNHCFDPSQIFSTFFAHRGHCHWLFGPYWIKEWLTCLDSAAWMLKPFVWIQMYILILSKSLLISWRIQNNIETVGTASDFEASLESTMIGHLYAQLSEKDYIFPINTNLNWPNNNNNNNKKEDTPDLSTFAKRTIWLSIRPGVERLVSDVSEVQRVSHRFFVGAMEVTLTQMLSGLRWQSWDHAWWIHGLECLHCIQTKSWSHEPFGILIGGMNRGVPKHLGRLWYILNHFEIVCILYLMYCI